MPPVWWFPATSIDSADRRNQLDQFFLPIYILYSFTAKGQSNFFLVPSLNLLETFLVSVPWKLETTVAGAVVHTLIKINISLHNFSASNFPHTLYGFCYADGQPYSKQHVSLNQSTSFFLALVQIFLDIHQICCYIHLYL